MYRSSGKPRDSVCAVQMKVQFSWCAIAMLCAACATPGSGTQPAVSSPDAFEQQPPGSQPAWPEKDWYRGFASGELDSLMVLAEQSNLDLAAATARIRQADARARAAGAAIVPQIDAGANATYFNGRSHGQSANETDWSALLSASYEVDFWGKNRATSRSAQLAALASQAERDTLALTTLSGVANAYFQVLSLRERLNIARANLDSTREVLQVIDARYNAGAATEAELATQRAAAANAELTIVPLQQQEFEARGALALLVGRVPEGFSVTAQHLDDLSEPVVVPGLPAELLKRRPDVVAAETSLQAAHADLNAARAALFPTLTLTGSGGVQNPALQAAVITLEGTGSTFSLGAALVQTIFDGGRRRAVRDEARAKEEELLASYRSAILNALLDVETALSAIRHLDLQRAAQTENVAQSERAFEGARLRYRAGAGDYLSMLGAQRTLYTARDQSSQYKLARLQAAVGLFKALGGGWQQTQLTPLRSP